MEKVLRFGRMLFIYDTEYCQREEDDPSEAICFLHPSEDETSIGSDALHLVCQLMGTALFTERNMATFPSRIRLQHGEFVLHREGRFIWAMHTSGEDETYVTRGQLARTRQAVRLLHGGLAPLLTAEPDRPALRRRLARSLRPLAVTAGPRPPLERVFDALPRLDWAQKDDFIGQQLSEVQTAASRVVGVLTCIVAWDGQIISNENTEELLQVLAFIHWLPEDAFDLVDTDFVLPLGTMVATVHIRSELHDTLLETARSLWQNDMASATTRPSAPSSSTGQPLEVIEERPEGSTCARENGTSAGTASYTASHTSSAPDAADGKENRPDDGHRRRRRRRRRTAATTPAEPSEPTPTAAADSAAVDPDSPAAMRSLISALALQALSAECARAEPPPAPRVDEIPVRRLRRLPRSRRGRPRRSFSDLDVPEPFSNLAYLKRKQPDLYRDELRKLQARLRDNQPAFTAVPTNPYSFGIPRSNRLYTPRADSAPAPESDRPALGRALSWRPWRSAGAAGYSSESPRSAAGPRAGRRRFFSEGEDGGWRPRQLSELVSERGAEGRPQPPPPPPDDRTPATLCVKTYGKLRCYVILERRPDELRGAVDMLERRTGQGLQDLECMLRSYRSIPSFHGHHYSYASCRPCGEGRLLETEGAAHLDSRLLQLLHADFRDGRFTDFKIRTPSDVLLAQRSGQVETYYQQQTSGHQHGLPVVNGPLSRLDERARKRLGKNHGLLLG